MPKDFLLSIIMEIKGYGMRGNAITHIVRMPCNTGNRWIMLFPNKFTNPPGREGEKKKRFEGRKHEPPRLVGQLTQRASISFKSSKYLE